MSNIPTRYLLDTNVLIEASKRYYAFDLVPAFWDHLVNQAHAGIISSIDKVRNEIDNRNTPLTDWANNQFPRWESTAVENTTEKYRQIIQWSTSHQQYSTKAKDEFANEGKADAWLVAHAISGQYTVVTEEVLNLDIQRKIPIPNVCMEFNVLCIDTFSMLHRLGIKLA